MSNSKIIYTDIPGYQGYKINTYGDIITKVSNTFLKPWIHKGFKQYFRIKLTANGIRKCFSIHELVALAFIGPRPKGMVVHHRDGNTFNNHVSNLEYCTHAQNIKYSKTG